MKKYLKTDSELMFYIFLSGDTKLPQIIIEAKFDKLVTIIRLYHFFYHIWH